MLPKCRRCEWLHAGRNAELECAGKRTVSANTGVLHMHDMMLVEHLGIIEHFFDEAHRTTGHICAEDLFPFRCGSLLQGSADHGHNGCGIVSPLSHRSEVGIGG